MFLRKTFSFYVVAFFSFFGAVSAIADSPKSMSLGGAGRSSLTTEAIFVNPALISLQAEPSSFIYYTKSRTSDWNSGGKNITLGAYDTTNIVKAGFSYTREQRSRLVGGAHTDVNKNEFRLGVGQQIIQELHLGVSGKYTMEKNDGIHSSKFYNGSAGAIIQVMSDMQLAVTYENFAERNSDQPPSAFAALHYGLWDSLILFGDGGIIQRGAMKGKKQWSTGISVPLVSDFLLAGGLFSDPVNGYKGKSLGLWWHGPRASFEYALKMNNKGPIQRDHIIGMNILL